MSILRFMSAREIASVSATTVAVENHISISRVAGEIAAEISWWTSPLRNDITPGVGTPPTIRRRTFSTGHSYGELITAVVPTKISASDIVIRIAAIKANIR